MNSGNDSLLQLAETGTLILFAINQAESDGDSKKAEYLFSRFREIEDVLSGFTETELALRLFSTIYLFTSSRY